MILVWISDHSEGCQRVIFNFVFLFDLLVSWNSTQELSHPPHFFLFVYITIDSWIPVLSAGLWHVCLCVSTRAQSSSHVTLFVTLWTVVRQAPLSVGFSRQEYWSRLPFPQSGNLPNPGIEPVSPAWAGRFWYLPLSHLGSPIYDLFIIIIIIYFDAQIVSGFASGMAPQVVSCVLQIVLLILWALLSGARSCP